MKIILPLLNSTVSLLPGPGFYFSDNVYVELLDSANHGAVYRLGSKYHSQVEIDKTKCIIWKNANEEEIDLYITCLRFTMNILATDFPVEIHWAGIYESDKSVKFDKVKHAELMGGVNFEEIRNPYKMKKVDRKYTQNLFKLTLHFCKKYQKNIFVIKRFNASLNRINLFDKVVDTCICMESLISGNTELSYRTALYMGNISETEPAKKKEVFKVVKKLYTARSKIVHGDYGSSSFNNLMSFIENNWHHVDKMLRSAMTYYVLFGNLKELSLWNEHLENTIFGLEKTLINEEV